MGLNTLRGGVRVLLAATILSFAAGTSAASAGGLYVALGDSYTSAPLVPFQTGTPYACLKSSGNYPTQVAAAMGLTLRDVSCAGASVHHAYDPHGLFPSETNPPQLNGVTPDAKLVTIGLGGNDAGLVGVGLKCGEVGATAPFAKKCREYYNSSGVNPVQVDIDNTAPKMAQLLQDVHARAPLARVAVVGYPAVTPHDGRGCWPIVPMSADDLRFVDELLNKINVMLKQTALANNALYVDTYTPSLGHDVCAILPVKQWFEGVVLTSPAAPLHPNLFGEASMARSVLQTLGAPVPSVLQQLLTPVVAARPLSLGFLGL